MIKILNCKEVAARLNKSEKTLSTEMVRRPTSLHRESSFERC